MQAAAADDKIYLVMGGSEIHCYISLGWALRNVPLHKTLVLVHVFRPCKDCLLVFSLQLPSNDFLVSARENILTSFELYVRICARKKVRAEKLIVENDDVVAALLDLIVQHQITTLILSSVINRLKKQADPSCSIVYQNNRNLISSSSNNTRDTLSSVFRDSCSTGSGFDVARLDNLSLENTASVLHDASSISVFDHKSLSAFKGKTVSHPNVADESQELHQAFHAKCVEMGIESVLRSDCKNFQKKQWILASKVAIVKKSTEKLFCILNMHRALFDKIPILTRLFSPEFVKTEVVGVVAALKDSARGMLLELKVSVQTYRPQHELTQGSVLTITQFLMKYFKVLVNHIENLDLILCQGQADDLLDIEGLNLTGRLVSGIIRDLDSVVQESSSYVPERLKFLFLMNNTYFVLRQVEESDVRLMVGPKWIQKRHYSMNQYLRHYLSSSWKQVIHPLETATVSPPQKRPRNNFLKIFYPTSSPLRSFESAVNKACKSQMHWKVCSPVLRFQLRSRVLEYVLQAYRSYCDSLEESVRGDLEDLEPNLRSKIGELFEG
ncbi:hypothetical protein HU200_064652 [Digitaria exilis]|uniref:Exocyst subunit Exo70 family protein n=1 Tax=Digitaria exilis TaxID=1010633 RepID=A0A835A125_9POAL|nr:hypothetical protein HU200_064652 [Digitaria exilis]